MQRALVLARYQGPSPLPPQSGPEPQPNPASERQQHVRRFAESKIAAPTPHVRSQLLYQPVVKVSQFWKRGQRQNSDAHKRAITPFGGPLERFGTPQKSFESAVVRLQIKWFFLAFGAA